MAHHHHTDGQPDWSQFAEQISAGATVHAASNAETFQWLAGLLGEVGSVLDLGAGTAAISVQLADAFPGAQVLAVEDNAELVDFARRTAEGRPWVQVRQGSLPGVIDELPRADLIWLNGVAHHLDDAAGTLTRLASRLRPGGALVLGEGGLPARFLPAGPDDAMLARLTAAQLAGANEHGNELGITTAAASWPDLLRRAGCADVHTRSFLLDRPAPLSAEEHGWVAGRLEMARQFVGPRLDADDRARLDGLLDGTDETSVLRREDLFLLSASTFHVGLRR